MTKTPNDPITTAPAVTQEQLDDYERYRAAELRRYAALSKVTSRSFPLGEIEDESGIVRGSD